MVPDNKVTVKRVTEGKPYQFRVAAVNDADSGEYAETKEAIKPTAAPSAPKALLDAAGIDIIANVGEPFRIKIPFRHSPIPTVTYFNFSETDQNGYMKCVTELLDEVEPSGMSSIRVRVLSVPRERRRHDGTLTYCM